MRIGIFGGSFDPVHAGHAMIASYAAQSEYLDEVWFMVSRRNPLKEYETIADEGERLEMVKLVCGDNKYLKASDFEFSLPTPSFTYDTLCLLKKNYPHDDFLLLIGADNYRDFYKWRNAERIIREFGLIVYPRPGVEIEIREERGVIFLPDCPLIGISSTIIRRMVAQGRNIDYFVTEKVADYIKRKKLYTLPTGETYQKDERR